MHPSAAAPARAQLWDHALAGVASELRAGGGTRFGRLRRKSYLGQRETRIFPRIGCGLRREGEVLRSVAIGKGRVLAIKGAGERPHGAFVKLAQ